MATRKDEGYLLDGSGNRVLSGSGEAVRTGSYDDEKVTQNRMKAAEDKLAEDVQKKLKADADFAAEEARDKTARAQAGKASDGDVSAYDLRTEAAANAPSRMPTRPGQSSSGRKPSAAPKVTQSPEAEDTSMDSAVMAGEARKRQKSAVMVDESRKRQNAQPTVMNDEARKRLPGKRKAEFEAWSKKMRKEQALERVTPELALMGGASGFGLKALQAAAKNLAGTGAKTTAKAASTGAKSPLRQKTEQLIREDKNPGRSVSQAPAIPKVSLKEKTKELIQSDRTAKSKEMSRQMAEKQTPTKFTSKKSTSTPKKLVSSKRAKKFNDDESRVEFKRGGRIQASSASKRADGIAQRGKTRGRMY